MAVLNKQLLAYPKAGQVKPAFNILNKMSGF